MHKTVSEESGNCTKPTAASMWWCSPPAYVGWVKMAVALPKSPSYPDPITFPLKLRHSANSLLVLAAPTSLPFRFSSPTLTLSLPLCPHLRLSFYLNLSGTSGRNCFFSLPILSGYNEYPDFRFSRTTQLISWPDGERYSCPLQSLVVSLLLSLVSTLLFSRTGGLLFHLNSSTHTDSLGFH